MSFVEDVNNLLNTGEVPNMFPYDERSAIGETVGCVLVGTGHMGGARLLYRINILLSSAHVSAVAIRGMEP